MSVMYSLSLSLVLVSALSVVKGLPRESVSTLQRRDVTPLTTAEITALDPYIQFARAAYCGTVDVLQSWTCGAACTANSDFEPSLAGGDGNDIQYFFVGYWPTGNSIIVGHEGTDPTQLESDLTDVEVPLVALNTTLFPGIPSTAEAHDGFLSEQALTADQILAEVQSLIASTGTSDVTIVGHSLGGAISELDALFLTLNIPTASISAVTFGTPRVGNPDFVTFFDAQVPNFKRVNHASDPIPIVPGRFLGYEQPHGEIHLLANGTAVACPGDDDATDSECQIETVPNILDGNIIDHLGPYDGIYIGTTFC